MEQVWKSKALACRWMAHLLKRGEAVSSTGHLRVAGRVLETKVQAEHYNTTSEAYETPIPMFLASYGYFADVESGTFDSTLPLRDVAQITHYTSGNSFTTSSSVNTSWQYEERYRYDHALDYLTEASYNGGTSYQTWIYDAAGNRASDSSDSGAWTYDNLNRISESPDGATQFSYEHDILGNRTWRNRYISTGGVRYVWDDVNRASSISGPSTGARYVYRADGMRVQKVEGLTLSWNPDEEEEGSGFYDEIFTKNLPTRRYYYDGQMMVEDDSTYKVSGAVIIDIMRYGIGARGIDWMEKIPNGGSAVVGFPVYDGHGSMMATAGRSGSGFANADPRSYDAWGSVRGGSTSGDPKQRYCANLGHVQDDESGLVYMRARYYEPWTGRFVSQDPSTIGHNWFTYCVNNPTNAVDESGRSGRTLWGLQGFFAVLGLTMLFTAHIAAYYSMGSAETLTAATGFAAVGVVCMAIGFAFDNHVSIGTKGGGVAAAVAFAYAAVMSHRALAMIATMTAGDAAASKSMAHLASSYCYFYGLLLFSIMLSEDISDLGSTFLNEVTHTNFFEKHK